MTRVEENEKAIKEMNKNAIDLPVGSYEELVTFHLGLIAVMITDISKSLAILADKTESEDKG